jgi:hypothetical protein
VQTFGGNLLQFARSVDSLQPEIVDGMKDLASSYFLRKDGLDACYFCVHRTGATFEGLPALKTVWSSEESSETQVVRRYRSSDDSESPSLRALAYNEKRCLWVTSPCDTDGNRAPEGATLEKAPTDGLVDQWRQHAAENEKALPPYVRLHDNPCRTLLALPLAQHGQKLGVLVVEFERQITLTDGARQEAELVQEALGRILWLQDAAKSQQEGTRKAFEQLRNVVNSSTSSVDPPIIFFAFPGDADLEVIDSIKRTIVDTYGDRLELSSWDDIASPGQITDQLGNEISRSRYGICYLSELTGTPTGKAKQQRYIDNPNVLIEAGMLHALKNSRLSPTTAWIPVRETEDRTETMPFDFVAERMILVPRGKTGKLQIEEFEEDLKKGIDAMLDD